MVKKHLFTILISAFALAVILIPATVSASDRVEKAGNIDQFISKTRCGMEGDVVESIGKRNGKPEEKEFEEVIGEKYAGTEEDAREVIAFEDFVVVEETEKEYKVAPLREASHEKSIL